MPIMNIMKRFKLNILVKKKVRKAADNIRLPIKRILGFSTVSASTPEIITDNINPKFWTAIIRPISNGDNPILREAAPTNVAATPRNNIDRYEDAVAAGMFLIMPDSNAGS